jgi:hypothetical protein
MFFTSKPFIIAASSAFLLNTLVAGTKAGPLLNVAKRALPLPGIVGRPILSIFLLDMGIQALGFLHGNTYKTVR